MKLLIKRPYKNSKYTIGKLYIDGTYFSDTLEDPVRDLNNDGDLEDPGESKIYGDTAIPKGEYKVILALSPKFKRILPVILNVKYFTGILFHRGNSVKDTHGCILVGENKIKGGLINSTVCETNLVKRITAAINAGEEITLTIE